MTASAWPAAKTLWRTRNSGYVGRRIKNRAGQALSKADVEEAVAMSEDGVQGYVEENAPELDPNEVREFIARNVKPTSEPGTNIEWAVTQLRRRKEPPGEPERPSLEIIEEEMRRHDETAE